MGRGKRRPHAQETTRSNELRFSLRSESRHGGIGDPPICFSCTHFTGQGLEFTCAAFPERIPRAILLNGHDHRRPYSGDGGLLYEPNAPGRPDPDPFADGKE